MQYVILCHTHREDNSVHPHGKHRETIKTHVMMTAVNRRDAQRTADRFNNIDYDQIEDGPFTVERRYEVAARFFVRGKTVLLNESDMQMIALEITTPEAPARAAE